MVLDNVGHIVDISEPTNPKVIETIQLGAEDDDLETLLVKDDESLVFVAFPFYVRIFKVDFAAGKLEQLGTAEHSW